MGWSVHVGLFSEGGPLCAIWEPPFLPGHVLQGHWCLGWMCMCACMCVYAHTHTLDVCVYVCVHVYTHKCTPTHTYQHSWISCYWMVNITTTPHQEYHNIGVWSYPVCVCVCVLVHFTAWCPLMACIDTGGGNHQLAHTIVVLKDFSYLLMCQLIALCGHGGWDFACQRGGSKLYRWSIAPHPYPTSYGHMAYTHTHTHTHTHTYSCTHAPTHTYSHMPTHTHTHVHMPTHTHTHMWQYLTSECGDRDDFSTPSDDRGRAILASMQEEKKKRRVH